VGFKGIPVTALLKRAEYLVEANSTAILTAAGVTGTITTAYLTGRASFKAVQVINDAQVHYDEKFKDTPHNEEMFSNKEKVSLVWTLYLPAVGVGTATVASIIFANRIAAKKTAALAVAYGVSDRAFQEYKEKIVERLGDKKELGVRDEIAQDRVNRNPVGDSPVIIIGSGDVLCYDSMTGRYFQSTIEEIKSAENKVNHEIIHSMYASLSQFYDELGLPATEYAQSVGWNTNNLLEIVYSTTMSSDNRPCIVIDFAVTPIADFGKLY